MPWRTTGHELGTSRFNREIAVLLNELVQALAHASPQYFQCFDVMAESERHARARLVRDHEVG